MNAHTTSVIDHVRGDESRLLDILRALRCDTSAWGTRAADFIHCPAPDHPDVHPSCSVDVDNAMFHCRSACGTLTLAALIQAHGEASDAAGAMRWLEDLFNIDRTTGGLSLREAVIDPSLTVEQYCIDLDISRATADAYGLSDCLSYHQTSVGNKHQHLVAYEPGWYRSVFIPYGEGKSPRVRSDRPDRKNWNAQTIRHLQPGGPERKIAYGDMDLPLGVFGARPLMELEYFPNIRHLLVVEGESDVLCIGASCEFGRPDFVTVGCPGVNSARQCAADIVDLLQLFPVDSLSELRVVIGSEPGAAGLKFPRLVAEHVEAECSLRIEQSEDGGPMQPPKFAVLNWSSLPGEPSDARELWEMRDRLFAGDEFGVMDCLGDYVLAAADNPMTALQVKHFVETGELPAAYQITALPDAIPATSTRNLADPEPAAAPGTNLVPERHTLAGPEPASVATPAVQPMIPAGDPWIEQFLKSRPDDLENLPATLLQGMNHTFARCSSGWALVKTNAEGEEKIVFLSTPLFVEAVESTGQEVFVRIAVFVGGKWSSARIENKLLNDPTRACGAVGSLGAMFANRMKGEATDLIKSMALAIMNRGGIKHVPEGTGWSGRAGTSQFGGIEVEPALELPQMMYQANRARREERPDTQTAAREWWEQIVQPLLDGSSPHSPAPLLAIGAAAAAPLVGPLGDVGVGVCPVTWLAGLGGGGKTTLQNLAASIFAPKRADIDGQSAYYANADMSRAALSLRNIVARDLPMILDDVMQVPAMGQTSSRAGTDASRVEAAAQLAMMIFNRKPAERATRERKIDLQKPFRSTALFSAEISLSSTLVGAKASAGQHRRIQTIETRPMEQAGLKGPYAELVLRVAASHGGAPGELLVQLIRTAVRARELRTRYDECAEALLVSCVHLETTQRQALAVDLLGFEMLAQACGQDPDHARADGVKLIAEYAATQGTTDDALAGVDRVREAALELLATNPKRFEVPFAERKELFPGEEALRDTAHGVVDMPNAHQTLWGRYQTAGDVRDGNGARVALTKVGIRALMDTLSITPQQIDAAVAQGFAKKGCSTRIWGHTVSTTVIFVPDDLPPVPDSEDPSPTPPGPIRVGVASPEPPAASEPQASIKQASLSAQASFAGPGELLDPDHHITTYLDGDEIMMAIWRWSTGTYYADDTPASRAHVQEEARQELGLLIDRMAREPEGPIAVAPEPAADAPGWIMLEGNGREWARGLFQAASAQFTAALDPDATEASRAQALGEYAKTYRLNLVAKIGFPQWFIDPKPAQAQP